MNLKSLGIEKTETHILTHAEWNGANETGVRRIDNGDVDYDSFRLIQHGWHNIEFATTIIKKCLAKNYHAWRIEKLMDYMKSKGWANNTTTSEG